MIQTDRGHAWITFENGYTISIFNGFGSYSENHFKENLIKDNCIPVKSKDCEIAIIYEPSGEFATRNFIDCDDVVKGNVSVNELIDIICKVKNYNGKNNE